MNEINDLIKNFTLDFFKKIECDVKVVDEEYFISVPGRYKQFFDAENLHITFNPEISKNGKARLIVPGSIILQKMLLNCKSKSPISKAFAVNHLGNSNYGIRFYFEISIIGTEKFFEIKTIDMDLKTSQKLDFVPKLEKFEDMNLDEVELRNISRIFFKSIEELRKILNENERKIIEKNTNIKNEMEKNLFQKNSRKIDDINEEFLKLPNNSNDLKNFDVMMEQINNIRKQQDTTSKLLDTKFTVSIMYELFAATIFRY